MTYGTKQFSGCVFNPTEKNLLEKYPELLTASTDERLLRYVIAMYDPASPFIRDYNDISKRKIAAAAFAGYDIGVDNEVTENLFLLKDEVSLSVVFFYLTKHAFPREWFMICCNEQLFFEYGQRLMKPVDETKTNIEKDFIGALADKERLAIAQESVAKRIDELYRKMFKEEVDIEIIKPKRRAMTPEGFAAV